MNKLEDVQLLKEDVQLLHVATKTPLPMFSIVIAPVAVDRAVVLVIHFSLVFRYFNLNVQR